MSAAPGESRLSPTSYVVLGLVSLRGPSTPYELKNAVEKSVAYFWTFPHSQLYREPERLAAMRARYATWEAAIPPLPADATFSIPYTKADLAQPS